MQPEESFLGLTYIKNYDIIYISMEKGVLNGKKNVKMFILWSIF